MSSSTPTVDKFLNGNKRLHQLTEDEFMKVFQEAQNIPSGPKKTNVVKMFWQRVKKRLTGGKKRKSRRKRRKSRKKRKSRRRRRR